MQASSTNTVIRATALLVCIAVAAIRVVEVGSFGPQLLPYMRNLPLWLARLVFGAVPDGLFELQRFVFWLGLVFYLLFVGLFAAAFSMRTGPSRKCSTAIDVWLVLAQALIALAIEPALRYIIVLELALVLPRRPALLSFGALVLAQIAIRIGYAVYPAAAILLCHVAGIEPVPQNAREGIQFMELGVEIVWQALAFCGGYIASSEERSRIKLANAHAELLATQQLLADALRASERARIAGSLHDALGHHLGDLNTQLEQAAAQAGGAAGASIQTSRELAQRLLAEVREVIGADGRDQLIDLRRTLEILCAGIPYPRIALSIDAALEIHSPALAHTIFCSIQEAITNAVRHSGAGVLRISLSPRGDGIALAISDDGKGGRGTGEGNGLRGLRERVEEMAGTLAAGNLPQGGFGLQIWLPLAGASS